MSSRNAQCPCGSGKKYKRCCISKQQTQNNPKSFLHTIRTSSYPKSIVSINCSSIEILKTLSMLQLQIQNHGKNIRLELAAVETINSFKTIESNTEIFQYRNQLLEVLPKNLDEDPPDNFFTENIVYSNGNNTVYPGIFTDVVEILQGHIDTLLDGVGFPDKFLKECHNSLLLLLSIQSEIAQKLGHTYRIFEEAESDDIYIPSNSYWRENKDVFKYTFLDIKLICDKYRIPYNTINQFVFDWKSSKAEPNEIDESPLFSKPFIFIDDGFLLVMPTAICHCLIQYILLQSKLYKCEKLLVEKFSESNYPEIIASFRIMGWDKIIFDFQPVDVVDYMTLNESIWKVDEGKYSYIIILTENILNNQEKYNREEEFSRFIENRIKLVIQKLNDTTSASETMVSVVFSKIGLISSSFLGINEISDTYFLGISSSELIILTRNWKFDQLTIWNYIKYLSIAKHDVNFTPMMSHLALYYYYKKHADSFFDSEKERYNFIHLDFAIAGNIRREGLRKLDKIGIAYGSNKNYGFMQCIRKDEHYPVYVSQEILFGIVRSCILKYSCPIWFESSKSDRKENLYITAILYWLNEIYDDLKEHFSQLGTMPILLELELSDLFYSLKDVEDIAQSLNENFSITYQINFEKRHVFFKIPDGMLIVFSRADNFGERYLIEFILKVFNELIEKNGGKLLEDIDLKRISDKFIPLGNKKMLLLISNENDLRIDESDIPPVRYITDADVSFILENQAKWISAELLPTRPIILKSEKVNFLKELVHVHYKKITDQITHFSKEDFLFLLMRKHESMLQHRAFRHIDYPAKLLCFSKYYDVKKQFSESEINLVETSLALRILIEFTVLSVEAGEAKASQNDIDILLAHVMQLINYASLSDSIEYDIDSPSITILRSGRIGISKREEKNGMIDFRNQMHAEEIYSYAEDFQNYFFQEKNEKNISLEKTKYSDKLNDIFLKEWNINLGEIDKICHSICLVLLSEKTSVKLISKIDFMIWVNKITGLAEEKIIAFLERMKFLERPAPLKAPVGFEPWEVYPWRFNRRLSYLLRPIISITKNEKEFFLLSARHILTSSENMLSLFFNGALKVNKGNRLITQLLAERNKIKGKDYRNEVLQWLKTNTTLCVIDHEVKIKSKGFFVSEKDKGDIDVLAIDKQKNIVYSIECKNTIQSKVAYDYKKEMDNYLGIDEREGLIQKHINRHTWLKENIEQVERKLGLPSGTKIESIVISKNILPLKHLKAIDIPVYSFYDLKSKQLVL